MILSIQNLSILFDNKAIINNFNLNVNENEKVAIKGVSGKGKTSLFNAILGFIIPDSGIIKLYNKELNAENINFFRKNIAWLPQQIEFVSTVKEFTELPSSFLANKSHKNEKLTIQYLLKTFLLDEKILENTMQKVSGGEKQRLGLINALMLNRKLLLLDEPISSLDSCSKNAVLDYLFSQTELTIVSTSHDNEWTARCDRVVEI
ncbi:MAG: hypothetical protein A2046_06165 [Bacteroidetes bacterium GWA2_30_7]|nr:MAG: hypothetical protein A2046_06165 [Bacteroidetes bacterium GWA2_30_7]